MANPVYPAHQTRVNMLAAIAAFPGETPLIAQACPQGTQTADLLQVLDVNGNVLFKVTSAGALAATGPLALTGNAQGYDQVAYARYNFAVDGGADSLITPAVNTVIPANAIVYGGFINATTAPVGSGASIAFGTSAGSSATSLKAATAITTFTIDSVVATVPVWTAATAFKMTAAGSITMTPSAALLTAGVIEVFLFYVVAVGA
jgi:hypothetical protein